MKINIMSKQLERLNRLRPDFMKWADSNEPSMWELDVNKINGHIEGFTIDDDPVILLDCVESEGDWYLCVNENSNNVNSDVCCYPLEDMTDDRIYEIRRIVESWLVKKDMGNLLF